MRTRAAQRLTRPYFRLTTGHMSQHGGPALLAADKRLFGSLAFSPSLVALNKQSRAELRLKARASYQAALAARVTSEPQTPDSRSAGSQGTDFLDESTKKAHL